MAATAGATITGLSLPPVIASNGPIKSGAGNFYVFGRDPAALNAPHAFKATDPINGPWTAMSTTGRSGNSGNIEAIAVAQNGDLVHVFTHQGLARVVHNMFDMGTDAWVGTSVVQAWSTSTPTGYAWVDAVVRSNGSVGLALAGPATSAMSGFSTLKYCLRDTAGTWTTNLALDSGGSIHWSGPRVVLGDADRIHFVMRGGGGLHVRTLLATNTLQAMPVAFDTAISADIDPIGQGASFVSDALHRVRVPYKDGSGYASVVLFDSSDSPTFSVEADVTSATAIHTANSASLLGLVVDGTTQHLVYADSALQDLFRRQNAGVGWSGETNEWAATINVLSARVLDRSGTKIALIVDNGGTIQYAEVPLGAVGTAITRAIGDSLAPSESASQARGLTRTTADALAPTEASATSLGVSRTVGESLSPTEAVSSGFTQSRAVGDTLSPTEAVTYIRSRAQAIADALSPTESVSYLRSLGRGVADSIKPVEAVGTVRSMARGVADTLLPTETASAVRSVARAVGDVLSPTERVSAKKPLALTWGVNLAAGEFAENTMPGVLDTDYTYPNANEMAYYGGKGIKVIRVPFRWERVQKTRLGLLDETDMLRLDTVISDAAANGMQVLIDMHNYARRLEGGVTKFIGRDIPYADFDDVWTKIANRYKANAGVFGYGLMNEPNGIPPVPGTFSGTVLYNFDDGTTQGWTGENPTHVTTPVQGGTGAVRFTKLAANIPAGTGYTNLRPYVPTPAGAPGSALRCFIRKPASTGGVWRARVEWQEADAAFTWHTTAPLIELIDDTWVEVSHDFGSIANVHAYGIQIETNDAPDSLDAVFYMDTHAQGSITGGVAAGDVWPQAAQAATNAIRTVDTTHRILVCGDNWGGAHSWRTSNENLAITDTGNNLIYEAHQYFDADSSGKYVGTYDAEGATPTVGVTRVQPFLDWCSEKNVQGYIGEYGVPRDDDRWYVVMDNFLKHLKTNGMGSSYWAGGPWWPTTYLLDIEPTSNFTVDRPQMDVLESVMAGTPTILKQVGDLLAPAENLARTLSQQVTVGDALSPAESLSRVLARSAQVADSLSPTEAVASAVSRLRSVGDALSPTETVARGWILGKSVVDTLSPSEAVSSAVSAAITRVVGDAISPVDAPQTTWPQAGVAWPQAGVVWPIPGLRYTLGQQLARTVSDTLFPVDAPSTAWPQEDVAWPEAGVVWPLPGLRYTLTTALSRSVSDTLSPVESVLNSVSSAISRAIGDTLSPVDAPSTVWPQAGVVWPKNGEQWPIPGLRYTLGQPITRAVSDALLPVDAPSTAWPQEGLAWPQVGVEWPAKGLSYTLTSGAQALTQVVSDTLSPVEAVARLRALGRSVTDNLIPTEASGTAMARVRSVVDTLVPTEAAVGDVARVRSVADALLPTEAVARAWSFTQTVGDALSPADISALVGIGKSIADTLAPVEVVSNARGLARSVEDSLAPLEAVSRRVSFRRVVGDSLTSVEGSVRRIGKLVGDAISVIEALVRQAGRRFGGEIVGTIVDEPGVTTTVVEHRVGATVRVAPDRASTLTEYASPVASVVVRSSVVASTVVAPSVVGSVTNKVVAATIVERANLASTVVVDPEVVGAIVDKPEVQGEVRAWTEAAG